MLKKLFELGRKLLALPVEPRFRPGQLVRPKCRGSAWFHGKSKSEIIDFNICDSIFVFGETMVGMYIKDCYIPDSGRGWPYGTRRVVLIEGRLVEFQTEHLEAFDDKETV